MKLLNLTLLAAAANANFEMSDFINEPETAENGLESAVETADATETVDASAGLAGASDDNQLEAANESVAAGLSGASEDNQVEATTESVAGLQGASDDNEESTEAVLTTPSNNILAGNIDTSDTIPESQPVDIAAEPATVANDNELTNLNDVVVGEGVATDPTNDATVEDAVSEIVAETGQLSLNANTEVVGEADAPVQEIDVDDADAAEDDASANTLTDGLVDALQDVHNAALDHVENAQVSDAQISATETTNTAVVAPESEVTVEAPECADGDMACQLANAAIHVANGLVDDTTDGEGEPIQASVDIAQAAQAEAAQAIEDYAGSIVEGLRKAADYENMAEEDKAAFDEQIEEEAANAKIFQDADRLAAGYEQMDAVAKTIYDAEMLKWVKQVAVDCAKPNSAKCLFSEKVRETTTAERHAFGYYELSDEGRASWDNVRAAEDALVLAAQTKTWHETNVPAQGQLGAKCSEQEACIVKSHCCGTFTSLQDGANQLENRCHDSRLDIYTDDLGSTWSHQCGAQKLIAAATALFSIGILLM